MSIQLADVEAHRRGLVGVVAFARAVCRRAEVVRHMSAGLRDSLLKCRRTTDSKDISADTCRWPKAKGVLQKQLPTPKAQLQVLQGHVKHAGSIITSAESRTNRVRKKQTVDLNNGHYDFARASTMHIQKL